MKKFKLISVCFIILLIGIIAYAKTAFAAGLYRDGNFLFYDGDKEGEYVLFRYDGTEKNIQIPSYITSITFNAFAGNKNIVNVTIPSSVTTIWDRAFEGCTNLENVIMPSSFDKMGNYVFNGCTSLKSIPAGLKVIGDNMFSGCTGLESVVISSDLSYWGWGAFDGCSNLQSITIEEGVAEIPSWTFCDCTSITKVKIPNGVQSIHDRAFEGCSNLKQVILPHSLKKIGSCTFSHCKNLKTMFIPNEIKELTSSLFENCEDLNSIFIPAGLTKIEAFAFSGCKNLTAVYYGGTEEQWEKNKLSSSIPNNVIVYFNSGNNMMPVVSDRDESLGTVTKGADLSLGSNKSGKLSAEVSEFFPANWSLGVSVFPVTLSQKTKADGSCSVKMAIGVGKTNMLDSKTEWSRYKQVVNDAEKYASLTGLLYRYAPEKRSTFSVSKFNKIPSLSAVGYMEQEYDKYGNLISSTGKIAPELAWKASTNWQFASPIGPWYATLAGGGKIAGELGPKYTFSTKKWTIDGKLSLKPEISLEGGYGINKLITAGVGGKLQGDLQLLPKSACSATASAYIHLYCAFLVDWQHDLGNVSFKLWGNKNQFSQKGVGWTCSLIDDSFAKKTSTWNQRGASQPIAKLKQNGQTDSMTESTLQSGILTSSLPIIKEINGTKVMIFQGYDSERSELNRTVLQYSVCKNGSWTTPKAVLDDGYADMYADMAVADGKLVLAWQKEKSEIEGSISDGANTILNDVAKKSEIWTAVFDEASGTFTKAAQLTDNDKPDMMPKVSEGGDGAAVTWLRSSSEDYVEDEGTITICRQALGSSKMQEIASTTKEVKEYAVYEEDSANHAIYLTENENGDSLICNEDNETLVSATSEEGTIAGLQYANGKLLYNRNGKMYELKDGEGTELTGDESSIPSSAIYCKNGDYEGFVWIANDDETGEGSIKVSMKTEDGFSEPVTVYTGKDKRIQYLSPVLESDGQWEFAANVLNQSTNLNELLVISKTPQTELTLAGASIDEYDVEDDLTAVHYYAANTELTPIDELTVKIQLEDGTEIEKTISQTVQPGETVSGTTYMDLSDVTNPQTASVYVYAKGQTDLTKNQVSVSVGKSDIRLTNTVEEKGSQAVITATLENVSDRTATTTLKLYSDEKKSKQLYTSEDISIEPWKRVTKTITVNKSDLSYNANQAVYMQLHADVAEGDCDESNNDSYAILYQAKTNTNTNSQTSSSGTGNAGKKQSTPSKTVKVKAPSKVKLTSAKNGKGKKLTVKWKKVTGAKGYQLQYAMNKKFKKKKSVQTKKTKYTIKKLKKKKTYYIRVRAYKMNGKKKVYGKWSTVKKVKIKK